MQSFYSIHIKWKNKITIKQLNVIILIVNILYTKLFKIMKKINIFLHKSQLLGYDDCIV